MEFYDMHSHILAKVDDGAENFEMSCRMLDMAYEEGIRHLCVTPHYNRHNADDAERPKKVMRAFWALELYAKKQYEDMHLYRGNEVMFFPDVVKYLESGSITTMNGGRYVLVEYKPNTSYHNGSHDSCNYGNRIVCVSVDDKACRRDEQHYHADQGRRNPASGAARRMVPGADYAGYGI